VDVLAISYDRTGPASVLRLSERPIPEPGNGEVRVRVVVSGVNPTDWKARLGSGASTRLASPQVPNQDGAGVVDAVGADVTGLDLGQRVWLWDAAFQRSEGTAQEFVVLPSRQVVPLPDGESFDAGASLGIPALTAHRALTAREGGPTRLAPHTLDDVVVLVAGGAGAVSHAAIQLAVWAGGTVITTVSGDRKAELARAAGAQHIINYRSEDTAARIREIAPDGCDLIVEVNATANLSLDLEVAAPNGTIAVYTSESADPLPIPARPSMVKNLRFQFIMTYLTTPEQKQDAVDSVSEALAAGALRVGDEYGLPIIRYPLAEAAAAHQAVADNAVGKVLIDVAPA
jgi:NADPH2:quinone reductase